MQKLRLVLTIALIVLVLVFVLQNVAIVEVRFLIWSFPMPRSVLIFFMLAVGVTIGWFMRAALRRSPERRPRSKQEL